MTSTDNGTPVLEPTIDAGATPPPAADAPTSAEVPPTTHVPTARQSGFSIASFVLSAASIVLGQGLLAIAGIVFGFLGRSREPHARTWSTWGLVIGFVSLLGGVVIGIIGLFIALPFFLTAVPFGLAGFDLPIESFVDAFDVF